MRPGSCSRNKPIPIVPRAVTLDGSGALRFTQLYKIISYVQRRIEEAFFVPRVEIAKKLYERIELQAHDEDIPVSKLIEKLLVEATIERTTYCPRCAFKF